MLHAEMMKKMMNCELSFCLEISIETVIAEWWKALFILVSTWLGMQLGINCTSKI